MREREREREREERRGEMRDDHTESTPTGRGTLLPTGLSQSLPTIQRKNPRTGGECIEGLGLGIGFQRLGLGMGPKWLGLG